MTMYWDMETGPNDGPPPAGCYRIRTRCNNCLENGLPFVIPKHVSAAVRLKYEECPNCGCKALSVRP